MTHRLAVVGADTFARQLAERLMAGFQPLEKRRFPDGEVCPRVAKVDAQRVVLAHRMQLPADPNAYVMEALLALRTLRDAGKKVDVVMPYLPYARQDRAFRQGEPVSVTALLDMFAEAGARRIFTVTAHCSRDKEKIAAKIPVYNLNGFVPVADYIAALSLDSPLITGPDLGSSEATEFLAKRLSCDAIVFEKERDRDTGKIDMTGARGARGRNVVIVDDMIASGGTMIKAIELCRQAAVASVTALAVHGIFAGQSLERLQQAAGRLAVADSIQTPVSQISVIGEIAKKIRDA